MSFACLPHILQDKFVQSVAQSWIIDAGEQKGDGLFHLWQTTLNTNPVDCKPWLSGNPVHACHIESIQTTIMKESCSAYDLDNRIGLFPVYGVNILNAR